MDWQLGPEAKQAQRSRQRLPWTKASAGATSPQATREAGDAARCCGPGCRPAPTSPGGKWERPTPRPRARKHPRRRLRPPPPLPRATELGSPPAAPTAPRARLRLPPPAPRLRLSRCGGRRASPPARGEPPGPGYAGEGGHGGRGAGWADGGGGGEARRAGYALGVGLGDLRLRRVHRDEHCDGLPAAVDSQVGGLYAPAPRLGRDGGPHRAPVLLQPRRWRGVL